MIQLHMTTREQWRNGFYPFIGNIRYLQDACKPSDGTKCEHRCIKCDKRYELKKQYIYSFCVPL